MKEHVKILVIGDAGVGKSSLISSYVSRYFSYEIPMLLTDCYLRADTTASGVSVTIMDSSLRQGDREILIHKIRTADSIIACYDTTRLETLDSLSTKWLPLIQNEKNAAKVIIVGTKKDLLGDRSEENVIEEEKRLQELFSKFPICIFALRSSSKLLDIDDIFYHAEQVVTYPLAPIYDTSTSELTPNCLRALQHIYRIYDWDGDGLLSDAELNQLHSECFNTPFTHEELIEIKKQMAKYIDGSCLRQNKVTFEGLVLIIKRFVNRSQFVTPWAILRRYGYDDDLNLEIPEDLEWIEDKSHPTAITQLSPDASDFLIKLYMIAVDHIKSSDQIGMSIPTRIEDCLGAFVSLEGKSDAEITYFKAIACIFSLIRPTIVTPWKSFPIYEDTENIVSFDDNLDNSSKSTVTIIVKHKFLFSSPTNPSYFVDNWLLYWHMLALYRPTLTQVLLYRLGYVDRPFDKGIVLSISEKSSHTAKRGNSKNRLSDASQPKQIVRICVLGKHGVGKRSLVWTISKLQSLQRDSVVTNSTLFDIKSSIDSNGDNLSVQSIGLRDTNASIGLDSKGSSGENATSVTTSSIDLQDDHEILTGSCLIYLSQNTVDTTKPNIETHKTTRDHVNIVATAVPYDITKPWIESNGLSCDIAVILFEDDMNDTYQVALEIESCLPTTLPRLFVANKLDLLSSTGQVTTPGRVSTSANTIPVEDIVPTTSLIDVATQHTRDEGIMDVQILSVMASKSVDDTLHAILRIVQDPQQGIPIQYRNKKERSILNWTILSTSICGFVLITCVYYFALGRKSKGQNKGTIVGKMEFTDSLKSLLNRWVVRVRKII